LLACHSMITAAMMILAALAGRYDNAAQVAREKDHTPAPQLVTITIEPTPQTGWQVWHVHMDVDPAVAQAAGSDTSLDAFWAMHIVSRAPGKPLQWVPYTLRPGLDGAALKSAAFDRTQWLELGACALEGEISESRIAVQTPADEMCVAITMGLGGKRAFLPSSIEREGDSLQVQLIYFGEPWRVDARRTK
jgi:hypothetical protein